MAADGVRASLSAGVDADNRLVGWVDMQDLALAEPREPVGDLARRRVRGVVDADSGSFDRRF